MGLGGYLFWTGVAREINKRTGLKCLPVEINGSVIKIVKSDIFKNNPHIHQFENKMEKSLNFFPLQLNNPSTNYCKSDTREKAVQRHDKHVIEQICEFYGINNPDLKCELFLTEKEKTFGKKFRDNLKRQYITIEPNTKDQYTVNKRYPIEKWQKVIDETSDKVTYVQIGNNTDNVLKNVINMTGKTTFREAASIIDNSLIHVGTEGGLMHAANALDKKSIILFTGFLHPRMTSYKENINIWIGKNHGPCGMKILCKKCQKESEDHDHTEITREIEKVISEI